MSRDAPITLCPAASACRAREAPRPDDAPVMSHVDCDIVGGMETKMYCCTN